MSLKRFSLIFCVLPFALAVLSPNIRSRSNIVASNDNVEWWQFASFYHIFVPSFKDSNRDGVGDLNGITENLSYLKELGITAAWLSPIFKSAKSDFGDEVINYFEIDEEYGNMDDFNKMITKANELKIKIILSFIPNFSSIQSEWFKRSAKKDPDYENFYIWHFNATNPPTDSKTWKWNNERQQYYHHENKQPHQPHLNYCEPKVKKMIQNILKLWLKEGVQGFFFYNVPFIYRCNIFKDPTSSLNDLSLDLVNEWRQMFDEFTQQSEDKIPRIIMVEVIDDIEKVMLYYGSNDGKRKGAQIPFNYLLATELYSGDNANKVINVINSWNNKMPHGKLANWAIGHYLLPRSADTHGKETIDIWNMILLSLPGASFTYYGEEIGMTNFNSVGYDKYFQEQLTPFQWTDEKNAGFSTADKTWCPISPNYKDINVGRQRSIARSTLNIYKEMQRLRKTKPFVNNNMQIKALSDDVLAIIRSTEEKGSMKYLILVNLNKDWITVNFDHLKENLGDLEYVLVNDNSPHRIGDTASKIINLFPFEGVILRTTVV